MPEESPTQDEEPQTDGEEWEDHPFQRLKRGWYHSWGDLERHCYDWAKCYAYSEDETAIFIEKADSKYRLGAKDDLEITLKVLVEKDEVRVEVYHRMKAKKIMELDPALAKLPATSTVEGVRTKARENIELIVFNHEITYNSIALSDPEPVFCAS